MTYTRPTGRNTSAEVDTWLRKGARRNTIAGGPPPAAPTGPEQHPSAGEAGGITSEPATPKPPDLRQGPRGAAPESAASNANDLFRSWADGQRSDNPQRLPQ